MKNREETNETKSLKLLIKRLEKLISRPTISESFRKLLKINIEMVRAA